MQRKKQKEVVFQKSYLKDYLKCPAKIRSKTRKLVHVLRQKRFASELNNHKLSGRFKGYRSINITGDYRTIFRETESQIILVRIGIHSQLYG